jgi:hypothetical protein
MVALLILFETLTRDRGELLAFVRMEPEEEFHPAHRLPITDY